MSMSYRRGQSRARLLELSQRSLGHEWQGKRTSHHSRPRRACPRKSTLCSHAPSLALAAFPSKCPGRGQSTPRYHLLQLGSSTQDADPATSAQVPLHRRRVCRRRRLLRDPAVEQTCFAAESKLQWPGRSTPPLWPDFPCTEESILRRRRTFPARLLSCGTSRSSCPSKVCFRRGRTVPAFYVRRAIAPLPRRRYHAMKTRRSGHNPLTLSSFRARLFVG
mmetsp:Transcript_2210/g.5165  ORF Transcript_2210/g.5165 Transcript_2210/m.5165 type:complete len:220 (+) Transcript_2210:148-807(+)